MGFNPYYEWFNIPAKDKPPNHYQLLGIPLFESRPSEIIAAVERRIDEVRRRTTWSNSADADKFLKELRAVQGFLLNADTKAAYDMVLECDFSEPESPLDDPPAAEPVADPALAGLPHAASRNHRGSNTLIATGMILGGMLLGVLLVLPREDAADGRGRASTSSPPATPEQADGAENAERGAKEALVAAAADAGSAAGGDRAAPTERPADVRAANDSGASVAAVPLSAAPVPARPDLPPRIPPAAVPALDPATDAPLRVAPLPQLPVDSAAKPPSALEGRPAPAGAAGIEQPAATPPRVIVQAPPPRPQVRSDEDLEAYLERIRRLLSAGLDPNGGGFKAAEAHSDAARRLCDADPRLDYALGLVALKHLQYGRALDQFDLAAGRKGLFYLPAYEAAVWIRFQKKDFESGMERLVQFAQALEQSTAAWPDERDKETSAAWIGRVVGWLEEPASEASRIRGEVTRCDAALRGIFSPAHKAAYEIGRQRVAAQYGEVLDWSEQKQDEARQQRGRKLEGEKVRIAEEKERVQDKKEKLEMTSEKWKEWIGQQTAEFDKQLKVLESSYSDLATQGQSLSLSITKLDNEIATLQRELLMPTVTLQRTPAQTVQMDRLLADKAASRGILQTQYDAVDLKARSVKQQAFAVLEKRSAAVAQYQEATGQLLKESGVLKKWNNHLAQKDKSVTKRRNAKGLPAKQGDPKVHSLGTYVGLDFETEKQRVLDSLPQPAAQ